MESISEPTSSSSSFPTIFNEMSSVDRNRAVFKAAVGPLAAYGALALYYAYDSKFSLFSYHPLLMTLGFITLAGNAILIKKIGGYENTKLHGIIFFAANVSAGFGWYYIYRNKELNNRPHLTSLHAKLGVAALLSYISLQLVGLLALHPDFGVLKTNKTVRFAHKWFGKAATALAWTAAVLGLFKIQQDINYQIAIVAPLVILGYFVLLQ